MRNEPPAGRPPPQPGSAGRHRDVVVNHQECMAILLGSVQGRAGDSTIAARERREAEEQVSRCSDFRAVPEGFLVSPMPAAAGALRGPPPPKKEPKREARALGQKAEFPLPESPLTAELTLQPHGPERVGMALRVSGDEPPRLSVHVREIRGEGIELVGRYSVRGAAMVVVKGLTPGQYVLEIEDKQRARRFRLRFDIESST